MVCNMHMVSMVTILSHLCFVLSEGNEGTLKKESVISASGIFLSFSTSPDMVLVCVCVCMCVCVCVCVCVCLLCVNTYVQTLCVHTSTSANLPVHPVE